MSQDYDPWAGWDLGVTRSFVVSAEVTRRRRIRRTLRRGAWSLGLAVTLTEDWAALGSMIFVTVSGRQSAVDTYIGAVIDRVTTFAEILDARATRTPG